MLSNESETLTAKGLEPSLPSCDAAVSVVWIPESGGTNWGQFSTVYSTCLFPSCRSLSGREIICFLSKETWTH